MTDRRIDEQHFPRPKTLTSSLVGSSLLTETGCIRRFATRAETRLEGLLLDHR